MTLYNGLTYEKTLGGLLAFSGWYFPIIELTEASKRTPVLIAHGGRDDMLPYEDVRKPFWELKN